MDKLLGLLGENQLVSTVGNVRDILQSDTSIEVNSENLINLDQKKEGEGSLKKKKSEEVEKKIEKESDK